MTLKRTRTVGFLAALIVVAASPPSWFAFGASEAIVDSAFGRLAVRRAGAWSGTDHVYRVRLKETYGIDVVSFRGCIPNYWTDARMGGYNRVSRTMIARRFDDDVLARTYESTLRDCPDGCRAEAREILNREHAELETSTPENARPSSDASR